MEDELLSKDDRKPKRKDPGKSPRPYRGYRRKPKEKPPSKTPRAVEVGLDDEGTPLTEDDSLQRPKGPVTPAKPVVIEIPTSTANKREQKPAKAGKTKTDAKKKEPQKVAHAAKEKKQNEEAKYEHKGIPISEIPKEFPVKYDQRVGIFVDVQNMFYTAKHKYNRKMDFRRLIEAISRKRRIVRAMAYIIEAPDIDQSHFKHVLEELGFELRIKDLRVRADGTAKGDWDMGIAIDSISMREKLDVVALVSGDGDFTDLVYMLRSDGIRVEVYSFPSNTAEDLKKAATYYHPLDEGVLMKW